MSHASTPLIHAIDEELSSKFGAWLTESDPFRRELHLLEIDALLDRRIAAAAQRVGAPQSHSITQPTT